MPIPSGYFCHTSCAIGKGRQPQQHDCPFSYPPPAWRGTRLPQFHPREPIFIDHPRRHRSVHFLFSRSPRVYTRIRVCACAHVCVPAREKPLKKKKKETDVVRSRPLAPRRGARSCSTRFSPVVSRGGGGFRDENSPYGSSFFRKLASRVARGCAPSIGNIRKNSTKLSETERGSVTSARHEIKSHKFRRAERFQIFKPSRGFDLRRRRKKKLLDGRRITFQKKPNSPCNHVQCGLAISSLPATRENGFV